MTPTIRDVQLTILIYLHCEFGMTFKDLSTLTLSDLVDLYSKYEYNLILDLQYIWLNHTKHYGDFMIKNPMNYIFYSDKNTTIRPTQLKKMLIKQFKISTGDSYKNVLLEHLKIIYNESNKFSNIIEN